MNQSLHPNQWDNHLIKYVQYTSVALFTVNLLQHCHINGVDHIPTHIPYTVQYTINLTLIFFSGQMPKWVPINIVCISPFQVW